MESTSSFSLAPLLCVFLCTCTQAIPFNVSLYLPLNMGTTHIDLTTLANANEDSTRNVGLLGMGIGSINPPESLPTEATGIVALWRCETAEEIEDAGPFNLTMHAREGQAVVIPGMVGNAIHLNGSNLLSTPNGPYDRSSVTSNDGFSVGMWVKFDEAWGWGGETVLLERQWANIQISTEEWRNLMRCMVRGVPNTDGGNIRWLEVYLADFDFDLYEWMHVTCVYNSTSDELAMYINGSQVGSRSPIGMPPEFMHGDDAPIMLGGRNLEGALDEVTMWDRPVTAEELERVVTVYTGDTILEPDLGTVFTSETFHVESGDTTGHEFDTVSLSFSIDTSQSVSPPNAALSLQVSTNKGVSWCDVSLHEISATNASGVAVYGNSIGINEQRQNLHPSTYSDMCLFPANSIKFRLTWHSQAILIAVDVLTTEYSPSRLIENGTTPLVPMAWNLEGQRYWSTSWVFSNVYDMTHGCCERNHAYDPSVPTDNDGYPLRMPMPEIDYTSSVALVFRDTGSYPSGTYVLQSDGVGQIALRYDSGTHIVASPANYSFEIAPSSVTTTGFSVWIEQSEFGNHVRNIRIWAPGQFESESAFHPEFISSLGDRPASLRFMDFGMTNGNNLVHWNQRTQPTSTQAQAQGRIMDIVRIERVNGTVFLNDDDAFEIETATPHELVRGQQVRVMWSNGTLTIRRPDGSIFDGEMATSMDSMAEVITPTILRIALHNWSNHEVEVVDFEAGSAGSLRVIWDPGMAVEYMIELSNEVGSDPWFCLPHLSTEDYAREHARLVSSNLRPGLKIILEYSNEIWNWGFIQTHYTSQSANADGLSKPAWEARRMMQLYRAYEDALNGTHELIKVVPSMSVSPGLTRDLLNAISDPEYNPTNVSVQAVAIAPYFGGGLNFDLAGDGRNLYSSMTTDDILDLGREGVYEETYRATYSTVEVANEFGLEVIAYEGGQHMGGGPFENFQEMQELFQDANRHPRMFGLYDNMYRAWAAAGGGLFATFSHVAKSSKWGSWGNLEQQDIARTPDISPKYAATAWFMKDFADSLESDAPTLPSTVVPTSITSPLSVAPTRSPFISTTTSSTSRTTSTTDADILTMSPTAAPSIPSIITSTTISSVNVADSSSSDGIGAIALAGIVVGAIVVLALVVLMVLHRQRQIAALEEAEKRQQSRSSDLTMNSAYGLGV